MTDMINAKCKDDGDGENSEGKQLSGLHGCGFVGSPDQQQQNGKCLI